MPRILEILQQEHEQHSLLLSALEEQIRDSHLLGAPDYDVVCGIVDYFLTWPRAFHHVRERQIFEKLVLRDPEAAEEIGPVAQAHADCEAFITAFAGALARILGTGTVTRSRFAGAALEFIESQRRHIRMGESIFYPTALRVLTPEDWQELDHSLPGEPAPGPDQGVRHAGSQFAPPHGSIPPWQAADRPANDHVPQGRNGAGQERGRPGTGTGISGHEYPLTLPGERT